jgi:ATP diphosphatase
LKAAKSREQAEEEIGDLLFSIVNFARHSGIDPEAALRNATAKFERRFQGVERRVADSGKTMQETTLDRLEAYWQQEKVRPSGR